MPDMPRNRNSQEGSTLTAASRRPIASMMPCSRPWAPALAAFCFYRQREAVSLRCGRDLGVCGGASDLRRLGRAFKFTDPRSGIFSQASSSDHVFPRWVTVRLHIELPAKIGKRIALKLGLWYCGIGLSEGGAYVGEMFSADRFAQLGLYVPAGGDGRAGSKDRLALSSQDAYRA